MYEEIRNINKKFRIVVIIPGLSEENIIRITMGIQLYCKCCTLQAGDGYMDVHDFYLIQSR